MKPLDLGDRVVVGFREDGRLFEFVWRGRRHRIREASASASGARNGVRCRTDTGLRCLLAHDPRRDVWRLERVYPSGG